MKLVADPRRICGKPWEWDGVCDDSGWDLTCYPLGVRAVPTLEQITKPLSHRLHVCFPP